MTSTCNTYVPKIQDWVDYYGKQSVDVINTIESLTPQVVPVDTIQGEVDVKTTTNISTGGGEMSTDIQVVSPVQTAVNQAMATKKRTRNKRKKKSRRRKSSQRKKKTKVSGKRRKKTKLKKKKKKKKSGKRDIFNY